MSLRSFSKKKKQYTAVIKAILSLSSLCRLKCYFLSTSVIIFIKKQHVIVHRCTIFIYSFFLNCKMILYLHYMTIPV